MQRLVQTESVVAAVKAEAEKIDGYMRADITGLKTDIDALLLEVLEYGLFNGGKRIRPLLVVLASTLCGKKDNDLYMLSCAFEYLHAATLFHDDIIDNSETRRGKQSVYRKFGTIAAILAGDFLHARAMATVGSLSGRKGLAIFSNATTGMVDGEFMQLRNAEKHNLSELDYYNAIMGKTGLLIAAACEVGAVYGGGDKQSVKALREYGVNLGCAFQIVDDLLDYQGNPEKTGKIVGNDLIEGKVTLPLILTIKDAESQDRARLMQILRDKRLRMQCIEEISLLIKKYGGFEKSKKRAQEAVEKSLEMLRLFTENSVQPERRVLEGLAHYVLSREK